MIKICGTASVSYAFFTQTYTNTQYYMYSTLADALMKDHFVIHAVTIIEINYFFLKVSIFLLQPFSMMSKAKIMNFLFVKLFFLSFLRGSDYSRVHYPDTLATYWYTFTYIRNSLQTLILNLSICVFVDYQSCIYRVPAALRSKMRAQRQRNVGTRRETDVNGAARTFTFMHFTFHTWFPIYDGYSDEIS